MYLKERRGVLVNNFVGRARVVLRVFNPVLRLIRYRLQFLLLHIVDIRSQDLSQLVHARNTQLAGRKHSG